MGILGPQTNISNLRWVMTDRELGTTNYRHKTRDNRGGRRNDGGHSSDYRNYNRGAGTVTKDEAEVRVTVKVVKAETNIKPLKMYTRQIKGKMYCINGSRT